MESSLAIAEDAKAALDLSEADLFFCGCGDCCESGWDFVPVLERAGKGVGLEASLVWRRRKMQSDPARSQGFELADGFERGGSALCGCARPGDRWHARFR